MFKAISNWLETKRDKIRTEEYDNGYSYAALQILKYDSIPEDSYIDVTLFDRGIRDAARTIVMLQDKAKKLEKEEQENVALREIVRKMQTELRNRLEQMPMQAPGNELPFKVEDVLPGIPTSWNWAAQDENGEWYVYEKKPRQGDCDWVEGSRDGAVARAYTDQPNPNWKDTLCRLT